MIQSEKTRLDRARQQWEAARRQRRRHRQDAARAKRRAAEARAREQDIIDEAMGRCAPGQSSPPSPARTEVPAPGAAVRGGASLQCCLRCRCTQLWHGRVVK